MGVAEKHEPRFDPAPGQGAQVPNFDPAPGRGARISKGHRGPFVPCQSEKLGYGVRVRSANRAKQGLAATKSERRFCAESRI